jgi:hypothetical protein
MIGYTAFQRDAVQFNACQVSWIIPVIGDGTGHVGGGAGGRRKEYYEDTLKQQRNLWKDLEDAELKIKSIGKAAKRVDAQIHKVLTKRYKVGNPQFPMILEEQRAKQMSQLAALAQKKEQFYHALHAEMARAEKIRVMIEQDDEEFFTFFDF